MITIQLMGGLGNQLFQIFATIAYAIEHTHQFVFPYSDKLLVGKTRPTYWHNFLKNLTIFTTKNPVRKCSNEQLNAFPILKEPAFHYTKIPAVPANNSISLYGYYQSYKYFEAYQDKIYSLILLSNQKKLIRCKYAELLSGMDTISMHFRLGDYKEKQQFHPIMPKEYYKNALLHILNVWSHRLKTHTDQHHAGCMERDAQGHQSTQPDIKLHYMNIDKVRVLYFCEAEDMAFVSGVIDYLKGIYNLVEFVHVPNEVEDWEQMLLMSCCTDNIVANSSFSWWGAYLNQYEEKCVCYPNVWFGNAMAGTNVDDLFPPTWTKIDISG